MSPALLAGRNAAAIVLLLAWAFWVGGVVRRRVLPLGGGGGAFGMPGRAVLDTVLGVVALHVLYLGCELASVPLTRGSVSLVLLLVLALAFVFAPPAGERPPLAARWGWGDALAALGVLVFAVVVVAGWGAHSDFVYHWALKGQRDALAAGIDWQLRAAPENGYLHPDYPNLLPVLVAVSTTLAGGFSEVAQQLWSVVGLGGLFLAARATLRQRVDARTAAFGVVAVTGSAAGFSIGYAQGGSADPLFALPVLALGSVLIGGGGTDTTESSNALAETQERALALGAFGAFACALKIEGMPLLLFAGLLFSLREWRSLRERPALLGPLLALPAVVCALWWQAVARHHLLLDNLDRLELARVRPVIEATQRVLLMPQWHGLPLLLGLLPLLVLRAPTRPLGALLVLQLGFYFWPFLGSYTEPEFHVLSSLPRLLLHLVPAAVLGLVLLAGGGTARAAPTPRSAGGS